MKCAIFYFSGTGNTKWVVKKITKLLKERKHNAVNYSIEKLDENTVDLIASTVQNYDYIGFAYPIHGADIPRIMKEFMVSFIKNVKAYDNSKAKLFFINTFGYVNGFGFPRTKKLFSRCQLPIMQYINFRLVNNTFTEDFPLPLGSKMPDIVKEKTFVKINSLVCSMEEDKKVIEGRGPHLLIGGIIRNSLKDKIKNNYQNMSVNYNKCIKCMKCIEKCPSQSIEYDEVRFIFHDTCETCWRCYHLCPNNAISMKKQ